VYAAALIRGARLHNLAAAVHGAEGRKAELVGSRAEADEGEGRPGSKAITLGRPDCLAVRLPFIAIQRDPNTSPPRTGPTTCATSTLQGAGQDARPSRRWRG
jgi:hypothetical protein